MQLLYRFFLLLTTLIFTSSTINTTVLNIKRSTEDDNLTIYTNDGQIFPHNSYKNSRNPLSFTEPTNSSPPYIPPNLSSIYDSGKDFVPDVIIGADGRSEISNTTVYPYSSVVHIEFTRPEGYRSSCTGFFYAANAIATSAHCLYVVESGVPRQWVTDVKVYPGRKGSDFPFASCDIWRMSALGGWVVNEDFNYDYAVLNPGGAGCQFKGRQIGWFGLSILSDSDLANYPVDTIGYPGDKPKGTMWESNDGNVDPVLLPKKIKHSADIWRGQSGSALAGGSRSPCHTCAYAIQSTHSTSMNENHAVRIDNTAFSFLMQMTYTEQIYLPITRKSSYVSPYPAPNH